MVERANITMPSALSYKQRLDKIQEGADHLLLPIGFRKKVRNYNRTSADGLIQVLSFGMSPYWSAFYGEFSIECGVFVPEIHELEFKPKSFVGTPDCALRARIGELSGVEDKTWNLKDNLTELSNDVNRRIQTLVLPFLDRFATRKDIVTGWVEFAESKLRSQPRSRLDVAIILARQSRRDEAREHLNRHLALEAHAPDHANYVRELAKALNL